MSVTAERMVVSALSVRVGDWISVGGRDCRVEATREQQGRCQLLLNTGEILITTPGSRFAVTHYRIPPPSSRSVVPRLRVTVGLTDQGRDAPEIGACLLCDIAEVPVIWLGPIQLVAHTVPLMACQPCTQHLYDRTHAHDRARDSRRM